MSCIHSAKQCKECKNATIYAWRKANPDKVRATKQKYYASEKGKACKRREHEAYVASGGRAEAEARRASKPLSEARKDARKRWAANNKWYYTADRALRRALNREASEFDRFVLQEAVLLAAQRKQSTGIEWHVDHVVPISKGGTSASTNIQVVPALWNRRKSNKHSEQFFCK